MSEAEWVSLCFVADITMGQSPESILVNNQEIGLPFLQGCAEFGSKHPQPKVYCNPPLRIAKNHSILISVRAPVGTTNFSDQDYCIGRGLAAIKAKSGLAETMYLKYAIESNISFLHRRSQGSTFLAIGSADLNAFKIPNLHIHEQQKISRILTSIDTAIEKTESLIAKYQKIKAGLMHDLFTRGVTADGKLRPPCEQAPELYQETAMGWIPKEWQHELLDELTVRGSGHTPSRNIAAYWNGGIKWISLADSYRLDKLYISDTDNQISKLGIQNSSATMHTAGVVVMSRDAGVGKSAITTEAMAVSQHFMCWRCEHKMDNHFLYYWLQYKKRMFENIAMGSTILTIGLPFFKKLKISAPVEKDEQVEIGRKLKSIDQKIFSLEADLAKKRYIKYGLMQDLLTGKVPVKIDKHDQEFA